MARLWHLARSASIPWLAAALGLYYLMIAVSAWRWGVLLEAQGLHFPLRRLTSSFFVATFFNNFLPSNIGGDVIRIADTAPAAGSRTRAATVVLIDRGMGLLGLVLIAAVGATLTVRLHLINPVRSISARSARALLWLGFARRDGARGAGAARRPRPSRDCCSRCACCTRSGSTCAWRD